MNENPDSCAPAIRRHLSDSTGKEGGEDAIRKALKDLGLTYKSSKNGSLLTMKTKFFL